jgi:8-oxo-dGTP pyrophosphatase MutT (NUDIX family)
MEKTSIITLNTVGMVIINDNKLLLAYSRNKKAWYLPGGKVDSGETPLQSLQREIKEELNINLDVAHIKYYCHIQAPAFGEEYNVIMEQDCFTYKYNQEIKPSSEIEAVKYFDLETYIKEEKQVEGVITVFLNLINDNLLI